MENLAPYSTLLSTPCSEWVKSLDDKGYGQHWLPGNRVVKAHRLAYCMSVGKTLDEIEGIVIRHKCDNRACIEPTHLEEGTQADNVKDMYDRGRAVHYSGEQNGNAKITNEQVSQIREMYFSGLYSQTYLWKMFGVSSGYMSVLVRGLKRV